MNFMARGLTGLGSSSMATDPMFQNYSVISPEEEERSIQPIKRLFDVNQYLQESTDLQAKSKKEEKWLGALGYALQLQNPNFNPQQYLKDYRADQLAAHNQKWGLLEDLDKRHVRKEFNTRLLAQSENLPTKAAFNEWFEQQGVPELYDDAINTWDKGVKPDEPHVGTLYELGPDGRQTGRMATFTTKNEEILLRKNNFVDPTRTAMPTTTSMGFIDKKGLKHLGYVRYDENRIPRYFLRNGEKVPEGWDMISPTATNITNILGQQGEPMTEARQVAMARMSHKWTLDAGDYFFDPSGNFKAGPWDIISAQRNVWFTEGRLAWTMMRNALMNALRLESGAAIKQEEEDAYKERFFPAAGDRKETMVWKLRAFDDYIRMLETINNPGWAKSNLPHPAWNPAYVQSKEEAEALPPGSYYQSPKTKASGQIQRRPLNGELE